MKPPQKIRATSTGKPTSEVSKFKEAWRKSFSAEFKAEFIGWFDEPGTSLAEIKRRVKDRHSINLKHDSQLSGEGSLREWCLQELANAAEAEWAAHEQEDLTAQGLSGEALRTELLDRMKRRAITRGDFKLGLATIKQDVSVEQLGLDKRRIALLEKKAAAFDQAKEAVESSLSPDELKKRLKEILK